MASRLHILDLPVDILTLILQPLVTSSNADATIPVCSCATSPVRALPILLVHPALYAIASGLLYGGANRFVLDLRGEHGGHVRQCLREHRRDEDDDDDGFKSGFTHEYTHEYTHGSYGSYGRTLRLLLSPEARRKVRRLEVRIDRLRAWIDSELGPLLEDMAVRGDLRELRMTVERNDGVGTNTGGNRKGKDDGGGDIFARPPMAGLLRLLADPDLTTAQLAVTTRHERCWCAFHGAEQEETKKGLVEVDWRAILRETDPEARRRAVAYHRKEASPPTPWRSQGMRR